MGEISGIQRDQQFLSWAVQNGALHPDHARQILALRQSQSQSRVPIEQFLLQQQIMNQSQVQHLLQLAQHQSSQSVSRPQSGSGLKNSKDSHQNPMKRALGEGSGGLDDGASLGGYSIIGEIARGGMGAVYRAQKAGEGGAVVALKIILAGENVEERQIRRFQREIEANTKLKHPHIIKLLDSGQEGKKLYYTMELVEGGSLASVVGQDEYSLEDKVDLLLKSAQAVGYAHGHGIFHRDLKPDNILLTVDGEPKVTDFGLAKSLLGQSDLTKTGSTVGTPSYMAPEQVRGETKTTDQRCDVWALGVIAYQMISGDLPFKAAGIPQLYETILKKDPAPLILPEGARNSGLEKLIQQCLEKDPEHRYRTATELAKDLEDWLDTGRVSVAGQSYSSKLVRGLKQGKKLILIPLLLVFLFLVAMPAAYFINQSIQRERVEKTRRTTIRKATKALKKIISGAREKAQKGEESERLGDFSGAREAYGKSTEQLSKLGRRIQKLDVQSREEVLENKDWPVFNELWGRSYLGLARAWRCSASQLEQLEKAEKSLEDYSKLSKLSGELNGRFLFEKANVEFESGQWILALESIEKLFNGEIPEDQKEEAAQLKGRILLKQGYPEKVLELFESRQDKISFQAQSNRVWAMFAIGEERRARALIKQLIPEDKSPAIAERIRFELKSSRPADGFLKARFMLAQAPEFHEIRRDFIDAQLQYGQPEEALAFMARLPEKLTRDSRGQLLVLWQKILSHPKLADDSLKEMGRPLVDKDFISYARLRRLGVLYPSQETSREPLFGAVNERQLKRDVIRKHYAESLLAQEIWATFDEDADRAESLYQELVNLKKAYPNDYFLTELLAVHSALNKSDFAARSASAPHHTLWTYYQALRQPSKETWSFFDRNSKNEKSLGASLVARARLLLKYYKYFKKKEDRERAQRYLAFARTLEPWRVEGWTLQLEILRGQRRFEEAFSLAEKANRLFPEKPEVTAFLILTRLDSAQAQDDRTLARKNLVEDPELLISQLALLRCLFEKEKFREAFSFADPLLKSFPHCYEARRIYIKVLKALKRDQEAHKEGVLLRHMLDPEHVRARMLTDKSEDFQLSDLKKSFAMIDEAFLLAPEHPDVFSSYCQARLVKRIPGAVDQALVEYGWSFFHDLNYFDSRNNPPKTWKSFADTEKLAQIIVKKYKKGEDVDTEKLWFVAFSRFLDLENAQGPRKKVQNILDWLERTFQRRQDNMTMRVLRGYMRVLTQQEGAQSDLQLGVRYCPQSAWVRLSLALLAARTKNWDRAFAELETVSGERGRGYLYHYLEHFREFDAMRKMKRWKKMK
jgi:serine/threonine protein kinase